MSCERCRHWALLTGQGQTVARSLGLEKGRPPIGPKIIPGSDTQPAGVCHVGFMHVQASITAETPEASRAGASSSIPAPRACSGPRREQACEKMTVESRKKSIDGQHGVQISQRSDGCVRPVCR